MAIAARVVSDAAVAAILAELDMPAERGRAALLDRRHDLELTEAYMPGIGATPVGSMAMKDVCDLQPRAAHGHPATPRVAACPASIVPAGRVGWLRSGWSYSRRGCRVPSCRAWRDPEVFESHEYRHLVRANAWRSCAAAYVARRASRSPRLGRQRGRHDRTGGPTAVRPGCGRETASLPAAAGCAAAPPATRRAAVRGAVATALHGGPCRPCRARRAAACARNRYRRP